MESDRLPTARVFISATSGDLGSMREIVKQGLLTMHCLPVEQTNFPPDYRGVAAMLEDRIRGCEAVVHLVGMRYGAEPEPATLPPGAEQRSYTQMEADIAHRLGKKLYVFLCPENFPYDECQPESEEKAALQRAYRDRITGERKTAYTRVADRNDVAQRVRELEIGLDEIRQRLQGQRRRGLVFACVFVFLLIGLGMAVWWNSRHTLQVVNRIAQDYDPERIEANLRKQIRQRAADEIAKLDPVKDWRRVVEIEKTRDQQLGDVDRLLEQMHQAYEKQEVSANYALASKILAEKGVEETLRFLAAKNVEREDRIAALKRGIAGQQTELRKVLQEKLLAASLLEKNLQFDQAEAQFRAVIADDPKWVDPRVSLAGLLIQVGETAEPAKGNEMLREAAALCRDTLTSVSRVSDGKAWARIQNNLGNALLVQGERADGEEGQRLVGEAVAAFRAALEVYTRERFPQEWAATQNNLGNALSDQGERADGEEAQRLLGEAVAAFRAALEVYTREQWPQDWAQTHINLGTALMDQGERADGKEGQRLLGEAATALRAALEIYTREQFPQLWAAAQNDLGGAFMRQSERASGAEAQRLLGEAVVALRATLEVYTREQAPQRWAAMQSNLGGALLDQGEDARGEEGQRLLGEAVVAYRAALEVRTRKQLPQPWAMTQNNLGIALADQGERAGGQEGRRLLGEAVAVVRATLEVYTREQFPQEWAMTQNNLGLALMRLGELTGGEEGQRLLGEAAAADRAALEVRTREQLPYYWAQTQTNLSRALKARARLVAGAEGEKLEAEAAQIDRELKAQQESPSSE